MRTSPRDSLKRSPRRQTGLTLVELMVSIAIGLLLMAAMATLIADQSTNRAEVERSGRLIENGRYAVQAMASDIQMAGYWGERTSLPTATVLPDPCSKTAADVEAASNLHVQGYDSPATLPTYLQDCVKEHVPGTDVLVVRRSDTQTIEVAAAVDGQIYIQSGLNSSGDFASVVATAGSDAAANAAMFDRKLKNKTTPAPLRKVVVHIYYVRKCSVLNGGNCTGADGGVPIPTLVRTELGVSAGTAQFTTMSIAEGIENLQIDYGVDTDSASSPGSPDGADVNGSALDHSTWPDVMSMKIHVLARSLEKTAGYLDEKSYVLGVAGAASAPAADRGYRRHVFVQTVRLVNPSGRRNP
jgi:type IV pilus assembly protein PilW